jgi:PAS domain S-box-containing protein
MSSEIFSLTGNNNNPSPFSAPEWACESELYRIQVRELTQYAMFVLDTEGIILSWNTGVQHILGYAEAEWVGQHASIIFTDADNGQDVCWAEMKTAAEKGFSSDVRWHVRKDGSELFGQGYMSVLRNPQGEIVGYSKIFSDETKNKQLQDSLTESNAALEQFAYVASHDLQEPLRTLSSYSEILVRRYAAHLDTQAQEFLNHIKKAALRMSALVQDLLTYARIQTEVDRPASDSLDQVLETALSMLKASVEESQAVVTHDPLPNIQADQGQMVRLFQNLLGNALKYRKPDVPPRIHVSAKQQESEWVIMVEDNGIGFDQKYAREIFAPFKRLHAKDQYEGTGVGLAICRRIVETHRGRIWAESKAGEGSKFFFTLSTSGTTPAHHTRSVIEGF